MITPGYYKRECKWNPTSGKLYRSYYTPGFIFSDKPSYPSAYIPGRNYREHERIPHRDIFMFVGGPGGRQRCPDYFVAYKVLWGERLGWLIYPEEFAEDGYRPIDPIRL